MNESFFYRYSAPIATLLAAASILFVMMFTILARPAHAGESTTPPQSVEQVLSSTEQGATIDHISTVRNDDIRVQRDPIQNIVLIEFNKQWIWMVTTEVGTYVYVVPLTPVSK